ncbi:hypothetical protein N7463_005114 [Penicillium fimorum]|uniref:Uncharacterized protein n=1 Tax=Penicillium fimorum TaxID=1882269 RepID=A0A9W9XRW0_9EURO|nr:hypothetical protein N7463_005114 [Penicillium fimorum]
MHISTAEQRRAVTGWITNRRQNVPTVDVPEWEELCQRTHTTPGEVATNEIDALDTDGASLS